MNQNGLGNLKRVDLIANATTTLVTGPGVIGKLVVHVVGTTATIDIYDNTAGSGTALWHWVTADGKVTIELFARFYIGCTIVCSASTEAGFVTITGVN